MSYQSLARSLGLEKPLPVTENWSAAPDFLDAISRFCLQHKPSTIVECSSGTSSIVLAQCCHQNEIGHVYSLENGDEFAGNTRKQLEDFSLAEYCMVLDAPLIDHSVNAESFRWYDMAGLPDVEIDLLVIDGPPGFIQKHSRYPALPLLYEKLAERCVIYLDDAARDDEQQLVARWLSLYPEFEHEYVVNDRGCSILRRQ